MRTLPILAVVLSTALAGDPPKPLRDPGGFTNPWPAAEEAAYLNRARQALAKYVGQGTGTQTDGEREKASYPLTICAFWAGDGADIL